MIFERHITTYGDRNAPRAPICDVEIDMTCPPIHDSVQGEVQKTSGGAYASFLIVGSSQPTTCIISGRLVKQRTLNLLGSQKNPYLRHINGTHSTTYKSTTVREKSRALPTRGRSSALERDRKNIKKIEIWNATLGLSTGLGVVTEI